MIPEIDDRTILELESHIAYCETATDNCYELFQRWWSKRKKSMAYSEHGREYWYAKWIQAVKSIRESTYNSRTGRCDNCGCKLKTKRCLACDLLKEMKREEVKEEENGRREILSDD